ncbi:MFS transporter [Halotalea alkalilenta]|uniref:MFS transporter n=1 Tax=Halotalea alkalilenta TaxID=376489 RepID=UPI0009DEE268|nr:MFS transporter [Halotalea alkalilenta]
MTPNSRATPLDAPDAGFDTKAAPTHARFWVVGMLFVAVGINYMDRVNLSIASTAIQADLGISGMQLGWLMSAFTWAYLFAQIPGGWLLDRFGTQGFYALLILVWSAATFAMGLGALPIIGSAAAVFGLLLVCRLILGLAQAPSFPANAKIAAMWLPHHERARGIGTYSIGQYVVIALMTPLLGYLMGIFGWSSVFFLTGGLGLVFAVYWWLRYRDPQNSRHANQAELDYISDASRFGQAVVAQEGKHKVSWAEVRFVMRHRRFWAICFTHFAATSILYFFLTWFIIYLEQGLGLSTASVGVLASFPYLLAAVGVLFGGVLSDMLFKRRVSLVWSRKVPIVSGLAFSSLIFLCNFFESSPTVVVVILSLAFFANAYSNLGWTAMSDILPKKMIGTVGGVFNICGNMAGILTPIMFGLFIDMNGNFHGAMYYLSIVAFAGALCFLFLVDNLDEIDLSAMPERG